ncbi:MAG TPA: WG repeat-containing protein, partial [Saprospiraceae bacterium]|nr:WG repeat-containing protein [Saprospiraceae bacterium]
LNCEITWHGLIDTFGKVVLKPEFRDLFFCNNRLVAADGTLRKYGILRPDLRVLVPYSYDRVQCTRDSCFIVRINDKTGILNRLGNILVAAEYDNIEQGDGRNTPYIVGKNERYALMDRSGRLITGFDYDYADGFRAGRAAVRRDGRWGYVDSTGREIIPLQYAFADKFNNKGLAWVLQNGKFMQIDTLGKTASGEQPPYIDHERSYSWGWSSPKAGLKDDYSRTVLNNDSLAVFPPNGPVCMYEAMQRDSGARWGLMDLTGRILTPRIFDQTDNTYFNYHEIVPVKRLDKWGYIHRNGTLVIPFRFDSAKPFDRDERAKVEQNGKSFVIDKSGKCVAGCN